MAKELPGSVLFCCDYNAVRSPMAESLLKKHVGQKVYVQSAGVKNDLDIDGFSIAVCREIGVELSRHRVRTIDEMMDWGDDIESYDLIIALSPAAQRKALELTRYASLEIEYWPIMDPTGIAESRDAKLEAYRSARDQIMANIQKRF